LHQSKLTHPTSQRLEVRHRDRPIGQHRDYLFELLEAVERVRTIHDGLNQALATQIVKVRLSKSGLSMHPSRGEQVDLFFAYR
jgi:hypothetical protein